MVAASWTIAMSLAVVSAGGPTGRWLGQDGHDVVATSATLEPNGYQDIHIHLSGLPAQRSIEKVEVRLVWGGVWSSDGSAGTWRAALEHRTGSSTADVYFESDRVEKGDPLQLKVSFQGGGTANLSVRGGRSNPNFRVAATMPQARWAGQNGQDLTAAEPGVGPDGFQDAQLEFTNLAKKDVVKSVALDAGGGVRWHAGTNPEGDLNAEFVRDTKDPSTAQFSFQPDRDLAGRELKATISYANGKLDTLAIPGERTDPKLAMPRLPVPKLEVTETITGRWLGQDRSNEAKPGDVHVELSGLPAGRTIRAAVLSDSVCGLWVYRSGDQVKLDVGSGERPLDLRKGADPTRADLYLKPYRNEADATLTLRLVYEAGVDTVSQFKAGACDPFAELPKPAPTSVVAKPGDDLNDLANRFGTVTLARGTHRLTKPLVLNHPITLAGEAGATLEFAQADNEPPWTTALKIHSGSTTLRDFAIRFAGRVRWNQEVSYGPAVIGTTDNLEPSRGNPKLGLRFHGLDVATPPPSGTRDWEEAIRLMRLTNTEGGSVTGCTLHGGVIEFFGGPWEIVDNTYHGTPPGTFSPCVIAGHYVHDLLIRGNRIKPVGPSGKTWRFLVVTGFGHAVRVENNTVEGIGPRDDDTIPSHNAPEIILTESYKLKFEGKPSELSSDGRLVTVAQTYGEPPQVGNLVSVLSGPHAGQWRKIAQQVSATTYLVDPPLPSDASLLSISTGFVNMRVEENTIDCRGGKGACLLVLAGNHFGPLIRNNRLIGGGEAVRLVASASEAPMIWGWSRAPWLGGVVEANLIEDSYQGGILGVDQNQYTKSNFGRTYMTVSLKNNTIRWSNAFFRERARAKEPTPLRGFTFGYPPSRDPGELLVTERGDRLDAPAAATSWEGVHVNSATVNGRRITKKAFRLPPVATRAAGAPATTK